MDILSLTFTYFDMVEYDYIKLTIYEKDETRLYNEFLNQTKYARKEEQKELWEVIKKEIKISTFPIILTY